MKRQNTILILLLVSFCVGWTHQAQAQATLTPQVLDQIVDTFRGAASNWEGVLRNFALRVFALLAAIEFTFAMIRLALRGADIGEIISEVVTQILFLGFFAALLTNSVAWSGAIVGSFREAANAASLAGGGAGGIQPSHIFISGVNMAQKIMAGMAFWSPAASTGLMIAGIVVGICFALLAGLMIIALIESYIVISAGVFMMGFGGSRWTKDFALKTLTYAVSVGAKLFVIQLIVGIGQSIIEGWASRVGTLNTVDIIIMIGAAVVMLALTKTVPDVVQGIVNGASVSTGGALAGATAAVAGGMAGAAAGMVGAGALAGNAARLASTQMQASQAEGTAPQSGAARAAAITGNTFKNFGGAVSRDLGRRLSGAPHAGHGVATFRMSADLAERNRVQTERLNKPQDKAQAAPAGERLNTISS